MKRSIPILLILSAVLFSCSKTEQKVEPKKEKAVFVAKPVPNELLNTFGLHRDASGTGTPGSA